MHKPLILIIFLTVCATAAVMSTWLVFNQTVDEPIHIACGLEWLDAGTYTLEYQHPPLARVLEAIGPYLSGARYRDVGDSVTEGNMVLHDGGTYLRTLSLARAGTLPFLWLSIAVIAAWARRDHGEWSAVIAVLLFVTLPPILAHAGLATTDMAAAATIAWATYAFRVWIQSPTLRRAVILGVALGAAILAKLSSVAYVPPLLLLVFVLTWRRRTPGGAYLRGASVAVVICFLVIWSTFRFSIDPVFTDDVTQYDQAITPRLRPVVHRLGSLPMPGSEIFHGIGELARHAADGHEAYFRGEYRRHGWIEYFPVTLAIKTPIPILLLGAAAFVIFRSDRTRLIAPAGALIVLLVAMTSSINIGVRHILPLYPFLVVAAAGTVRFLWERRHVAVRAAVVLLIGWQCTKAAMAHPDHLAWFNEIADDEPEAWLLDSNLDWGQDLLRLRNEARARGIKSLGLSYFGTAVPEKHDLPPPRPLDPDLPSDGWIAVSLMNRHGVGIYRQERAFRWLDSYVPDRIGSSILLYHVPPTALSREVETLLVPVLIGSEPLRMPQGGALVTEAVVNSTHQRPVTIATGPALTVIRPGIQTPPELVRRAVGGNLVRIPIAAAPHISISVTLKNLTTGAAQPVPVLRAGDVAPGPKEVALSPGESSRTVRIYDVGPTHSGTARVAVFRGEQLVAERTLSVGRTEPGGPAYSELDLSAIGIREGRGLRLRVEPLDASMRLWPLLVEVDRHTEQITLREASVPLSPAQGEGNQVDEEAAQKPTR